MLDFLWGGEGLLLTLLATTTEAEDEMEGRLLLNVVVGQRASVFKLLAREDQTLLIGRDTLLVLDIEIRSIVIKKHVTNEFRT